MVEIAPRYLHFRSYTHNVHKIALRQQIICGSHYSYHSLKLNVLLSSPCLSHVCYIISLQVVIMAQFELEVSVEDYDDPVDVCGDGLDICVLYIADICLGPQIEDDESCSLERDGDDLDLDDDELPRTRTLTVMSQPWPVSRRLIPVYR